MKFIITSVLLIASLLLNAQLKIVNTSLLELEQNVYQKSFSKKWKKTKQVEWEAKCAEAKDVKAVNTLFNEYSDLLAQSASFSMGNSDAASELDFAKYLILVEGTLGDDLVANWSEVARTKWKTELNEFIEKQEQKFKEEDLMRKFHVVTGIVKGFEKNFPIVWEDSKKNSLKNIDVASLTFKGGSDESIKTDEYGVKSFAIFFKTEDDLQMAVKILIEMQLFIASEVGPGYKKTNEHDGEFNNNNKFIYQFEGEKFSETAKRSTVVIGVKTETPGVYLEIFEPVFGH